VIFEEKGGDPTKISFGRRRVTGICGFVSEDHPSIDLESWDKSLNNTIEVKAALQLTCPESMSISSIKFASYGNPSGSCGTYSQGNCHYSNTNLVIEQVITSISTILVIKLYSMLISLVHITLLEPEDQNSTSPMLSQKY